MSARAVVTLRRHRAPNLLIAYAEAVAQLPINPDAKRLRRNAATGLLAIHPRLVEWCRAEMAVYKAPRQVRFVDALPKTASGKILKRMLREKAKSTG